MIPTVAKAIEYLSKFVQEDGGIYKPGSTHRNYETCLAVVAFHLANKDGKYNDLVANAEKYIKEVQWDAGEGHDESSMSYGGAGYGSHSRPDLSNTSFLIDTLKELGTSEDDPAIQAALVFVSRCQNLKTDHNETKFADKVSDGGFYYTIAAGGSSQAGDEADGGLRSYGSMTYAGLKSMLYAGVKADDERVKAAYDWITKNYTVAENPGMADSGLYYYYHTFAKSLDAVGKPAVVDDKGTSHDWKAELVEELGKRQKEDGRRCGAIFVVYLVQLHTTRGLFACSWRVRDGKLEVRAPHYPTLQDTESGPRERDGPMIRRLLDSVGRWFDARLGLPREPPADARRTRSRGGRPGRWAGGTSSAAPR